MVEQPETVDLETRVDHLAKKQYVKPVLTEGSEFPTATARVPAFTVATG